MDKKGKQEIGYNHRKGKVVPIYPMGHVAPLTLPQISCARSAMNLASLVKKIYMWVDVVGALHSTFIIRIGGLC